MCVSIQTSTKLPSPVISSSLGCFSLFFVMFCLIVSWCHTVLSASPVETSLYLVASLISSKQGHHNRRKTVQEKRQFCGHLLPALSE